MADRIYPAALEWLSPSVWDSLDLRVLLLDAAGSYVFDEGDEHVADLSPGSNELGAITGYERKTLGGLDTALVGGRWELLASNVTYTDLGDGESPFPVVQAAVVYEHVSDDADHRLVAYVESVGGATNGETATVAWTDGVVLRVAGP